MKLKFTPEEGEALAKALSLLEDYHRDGIANPVGGGIAVPLHSAQLGIVSGLKKRLNNTRMDGDARALRIEITDLREKLHAEYGARKAYSERAKNLEQVIARIRNHNAAAEAAVDRVMRDSGKEKQDNGR